jgi:L-ascorbate metabolism protein UlaG (beta-lactamase superfamily)
MEIQFYGGNCVRLTAKKASVIVDDNLVELGLKSVTKDADIALLTQSQAHPQTARLTIDQPGEYEVSDISIQGVSARAHMDEQTQQTATVFKVIAEDIRVAVVGHIFPKLSETQLEALGTIDVLIIPVGNNGFTLDSVGALQLIKAIEPKLIIPTHFDDKDVKYPVPQQGLTEALKGLAMEPKDTVAKIKLKPADFSDATELLVLERQ